MDTCADLHFDGNGTDCNIGCLDDGTMDVGSDHGRTMDVGSVQGRSINSGLQEIVTHKKTVTSRSVFYAHTAISTSDGNIPSSLLRERLLKHENNNTNSHSTSQSNISEPNSTGTLISHLRSKVTKSLVQSRKQHEEDEEDNIPRSKPWFNSQTQKMLEGYEFVEKHELQAFENFISKSCVVQKSHGHTFVSINLSSPTWCDKCGDFIWGVYKQCLVCTSK